MGSIRPFVRDSITFDPEATDILSLAFGDACKALQVDPTSILLKQCVADCIVTDAKSGILDRNTLAQRAVNKLISLRA